MTRLNKILIGIIMLVLLLLLYNTIRIDKYKNEYYKYKNNYDIMKYHYAKLNKELNDRQVYITQRDLHLMYSNLLQRIKEYGIKEKHIDNIITYDYKIKDTSLVRVVYDTINHTSNFMIEKDCYTLFVDIKNDTANVKVNINDTFDIVLYRKINKDISWIKRLFNKKLRYNNHVLIYSNCKKDTIVSTTNVKVVE